ncbi:hypothetical protein VNO78_19970 [Psophocarpus tetragonolobus]|uniref:DOG1 domain-containing protein n=1 Tax=Psophocarpus tetragonolobus TaxID=3891 RepID=A0AAN9XGP0_PSOTE
MKPYFELFQKKTSAANVNVFKVAERNLRWIGGFRPSQLLQVILAELQYFCSQQELSDIYKFVQTCQQAEDALTQGMKKLQETFDKATVAGEKGLKLTCVQQQMSFLKQANHVRQEFLYQLSRLLTTCQHAQFLLALGDPLPCTSL